VLAARVVAPALTQPTGGLRTALFLLESAIVATAAATWTDRATRRLLPLSALFHISLVFPDEAPSRFRVALRAGSTKRIAAEMSASDAPRRWGGTPEEAATLVLEMVSALGRHDRLTRGHTERVRAYSDLIAEELELARSDREMLRWGVLVHDIGKLAVPHEVLNKKARLTAEEWAILKGHPAAGERLLRPLAEWLGAWRLAASEHHERFDGTGYPKGLAGLDISLAGRIVAVADAYDVITSTRSYKRPMSAEAARAELVRCAGTQFDPVIVRAMLNVSLGKLRLVSGPFGAIGNVPLLAKVPGLSQAVASGSVIATSAFVATALSLGAVPEAVSADQDVATAAIAPPAEDAQQAVGVGRRSRSTSLPSQSSITSTVTVAPDTAQQQTAGIGIVTTTAPSAGPATTTNGSTSRSSVSTPQVTTTPPVAPTTPATPAPPPTVTPPPETIAPPAATPALQPDSIVVQEDKDEHVDVLLNDAPSSGTLDERTLTIVQPPQFAHDYRVHGDHLHYRSLKNFTGTDTLTYQVCDTSGACATTTVTITVIL
jgi:HD-GYP domain-containing protein (c-di-GMP phosphodiesterase class II)